MIAKTKTKETERGQYPSKQKYDNSKLVERYEGMTL